MDLAWTQHGGFIDDASRLNKTPVYGIVQVKEEEDIRNALHFAKENRLKVSLAGMRHSMGGQAFYKNVLVLDMTQFNKIVLNEQQRTITVQSGAIWHDIQNFLHPRYAVKVMQSIDIFTIGGSIAANAHGMDHHVGALATTIHSMRLMLTNGSIKIINRYKNKELFTLVIGGYGLFGVILDAEIEITDNVIYKPSRRIIDYREFPDVFKNELRREKTLGLFYSHLSTAPQSLLREMILYIYEQQSIPDAVIPPLGEITNTTLRRFVLNFSKLGSLPKRIKWFAEKYVEPWMEPCSVTRSQAMGGGTARLISRNEAMHDSGNYLKNKSQGDTNILHEYFIPRDQVIAFIDKLRQIVMAHTINLLNVSVRVVHKEENFLNYAPVDVFSIVLYINQGTTPEDNEKMRIVTSDLIDVTISFQGRFFLSYQLHYTPAQLIQAYPEIKAFFTAKKRYDPDLVLTNTFYEKYSHICASM
jgi:FAD/FMN-containing dehydrogenase